MKVGFLIIARLKSTRLKRKVLLEVAGKPILEHLVDRLKYAKTVSQIVVCTSTNPQDDDIVHWARQSRVDVFRGHEDDVLERLYDASRVYGLDYILHITADCPFADPFYCDRMVEAYRNTGADLITAFDLPHGAYIYGIKPAALKKVMEIKDDTHTEVWGRYFTDTGLFHVHRLPVEKRHRRPEIRGTIDYPEDYEYLKQVFAGLYVPGRLFSLDTWIDYHDMHPDVAALNQECKSRFLKRFKSQSDIRLKPRCDIRTAIILGAGSIGQRHIRNLRQVGITDITALRTRKGHFKSLPSELGLREVCDWSDVATLKPDIAVIANPTVFHAETVRYLLPYTRGFLIEKPLSHTVEGLQALLSDIHQSRTTCFVGYNLQFHAAVRTIHQALTEGEFGNPLSYQGTIGHWLPDWHPYEDYKRSYAARQDLGGGVLRTLIHEINLAVGWLGLPQEVTAFCSPCPELNIDDVDVISDVMIRHDSGAISQLHFDYVQRLYHREGIISCEYGWIRYDLAHKRVWGMKKGDSVETELWNDPAYDINQCYLEMLNTFVQYVREGRTRHFCDALAGAVDVALVCSALESATNRQWQSLIDTIGNLYRTRE